MNKQEEAFFVALYKDRAESANMLEKPSMRGIKTSVVEKYSDQAHFIYELLQNADDAKASSARFVLSKDKLVFAHNGTRRFSISDPATEDEDSASDTLGDINAITSIANSNKREASIGKFGVGFKAVFQYTSAPQIYDPSVRFKIERFIVPEKIQDDFDGRKPDETLFLFPFDHTERSAEEAFEDISEKLRSLDYPILFLSNLKDVSLELPDTFGLYGKSGQQKRLFGDTVAEFVCLTQNDGDELYEDMLWLFSRNDNFGRTYSIGFFVDEDGHLTAKRHPAFCFFPTKEVTSLNFIIHAPFLLTDSRENIRAGVKHNKDMVELLADLAADSVGFLKEIGQEQLVKLIDDNVFDIIPYDDSLFNDVNDNSNISFKPFYSAIKNKFQSASILPSSDGYVERKDAYWVSVSKIAEVFSNSQLAALVSDPNSKWAFVSFSRDEIRRNKPKLLNYVDSITRDWIEEDKIIGRITKQFIEAQPIDWLHKFYKWVSETSGRTKLIKSKPIFLNQDGNAVPAFDLNGQSVLFLPIEDVSGYVTVHPSLMENMDTVQFLEGMEVKTPSLRDEVYNIILPQYRDGLGIDTDPHFKKFFKYYSECPNAETKDFIAMIKDCAFISYSSASDETVYRGLANELYFPNDDLIEYFKATPETKFVELDEYKSLVGKSNEEELIDFLVALGIANLPKVNNREITRESAMLIKSSWHYSTRPYEQKWSESYLDGCKNAIDLIVECSSNKLSFVLWSQLLKVIDLKCSNWKKLDRLIGGNYQYFYRSLQQTYFESSDTVALRTTPWLLNVDGEFVSASELSLQSLSLQYDRERDGVLELLHFLNIQDEVFKDGKDNLTDEQRRKIEIADKIESAGITPEELDLILCQRQLIDQNQRVQESTVPVVSGEATDDEDHGTSVNPKIFRVIREITKRIESQSGQKEDDANTDIPVSDEDDYTKPTVDFSKKIEQAKQRSVHEIAEIARLEELTQQALNVEKYSYAWFRVLLELESLNSGERNANSREISITFSKVEREESTSRILILKHPSRYIPQSMEDLADIPLELHFANQRVGAIISDSLVR